MFGSNPFDGAASSTARLGGDLKMGLGPNLTLDATVNPDFGQVEVDPAYVNLTAFEQELQERRPFFVEGGELFRFGGNGGGLVKWLSKSLNVDTGAAALQKELAALEPDAHGLTILPFWSGERSPGWSADARGTIFGLRQQTTSIEIMRASLESIAYRFSLIARALDQIAPGAAIFASGNALRSSPVWLQIIADVLGRPLMFGGTAEASIRGAALLALEAVGKIATIEKDSIAVEQVFEPDMTRHALYQEGLARQEELYERLFSRS